MARTIIINGVIATPHDYEKLCEDFWLYNMMLPKPVFFVKTMIFKNTLYIETFGL